MARPYPIQHISSSGGYPVATQEKADLEALMKLFEDIINERTNQSIVLPRSIVDGVDDYKSMYSLLPGLPIAALSIRNLMLENVVSDALGSSDVLSVVDAINATKPGNLDAVTPVPERRIGSELADNWLDLYAGNKPDGAANLFLCMDTPLAYNAYSKLMDEDAGKFDIVIDFNTKKAVSGLFDRNFYDYLIDEKELQEWKEPNTFILTERGLEHAVPFITKFHENRRGGSQLGFLIKVAIPQIGKHLFDGHIKYAGSVAKGIAYLITRTPNWAVSSDEASEFAKVLVSPWGEDVRVRIKGRHTDPFFVRDIDGLHDWAFYRAVMENVAYKDDKLDIRNLSSIYPYAEHLAAASEELSSKGIRIVDDFDGFINDKVARLNAKLPSFGSIAQEEILNLKTKKRYKKISESDWEQAIKKMESYQIPIPVIDGKVNYKLIHPDENTAKAQIKTTIDYITQQKSGLKPFPGYLAQYAIDKARFTTLTR